MAINSYLCHVLTTAVVAISILRVRVIACFRFTNENQLPREAGWITGLLSFAPTRSCFVFVEGAPPRVSTSSRALAAGPQQYGLL